MPPRPDPGSNGDDGLAVSRRAPVSFAVFALARAHRALAGRLLADLGLHPGQELLLMLLWERDGQSQRDLTRTIGLDHSTVVRSLQRLEASGLVTRARSVADGRLSVVFLTDRGRDLRAQTMAAWDELERRTVAGLTAEERSRFVALARTIAAGLDT